MKKETKRKLLEWLISLAITLVMLGIVTACLYWFTGKVDRLLDMTAVWIANAVGGIIMLFIVHHFVKRPDDTDKYR